MRRTRKSICCQNCTLRLHTRPFRTHRGGHQLHQQLPHQTQIAKTFFTFNRHFNSTETAQMPTLPAHQVERASMVRYTSIMVGLVADLEQMPSQDEYKNSVAQHQQSTFRTYYLEAPISPIVAPSRIPSSGEHLLDSSPIN
jgi:hypothetical protein